MSNDAFKQRLLSGELLVGTMVTLPSTVTAEILSLSGFDWLFVDLEHGPMALQDAMRIMQTVSPGTPCLMRVPLNDEAWIKRALDIGPAGVVVPQIRSVEDAARAVRYCKYPPAGIRGVGIGRAHGYGERFEEYVASSNDQTAVIIQIEHIDAVNDIEDIAKVPGIDGWFVGPYDLSGSMGKIGAVTDPEVQEAIARVTACATKANIPMGIFGASVDAVNPFIAQGYNLIAVSLDILLLGAAAKSITASFK